MSYIVKEKFKNANVGFRKTVKGVGKRIQLSKASQKELEILYNETDAKEMIEKKTSSKK